MRERERERTRNRDALTGRKACERKERERDERSASRGPNLSGQSADPLKEGGTSETAGHLGE